MGGAASCSRGERLAVGGGQPLRQGGLPGGEPLPHLHGAALQMPERELLLDGALLHLLCDELGGTALDAAEGPTGVGPTLAAEARRAGPSRFDPRPSSRGKTAPAA